MASPEPVFLEMSIDVAYKQGSYGQVWATARLLYFFTAELPRAFTAFYFEKPQWEGGVVPHVLIHSTQDPFFHEYCMSLIFH